ncbi:S9 family peptidase [Neiella marina]|uniref:Acyl-peptide hydrolase n=1 Tax=Neiella holothuriorum TaxID=2870530 RepID=A0ABS7EJD4_9GAMM|nr:S9 family peptidase [Neiella holothuriorum]MBW8192467.1 S9 family peptidase [Neiella holothuriorum]
MKSTLWMASLLCSSVMLASCGKPSSTATTEQQSASPTPTEQIAKTPKAYSAADFFETTTVFGSSINHDGSAVLVTSDESGVFNLYKYPVDGAKPTQLTHSEDDAFWGVSWFPNDNRALYTADKGGDELSHLYVLDEQGNHHDLTPGEGLKASFYGWSDDDKGIYVATNERDNKAFDLYLYDISNFQRLMVFENTDAWQLSDVSKDGRWLALIQVHTNANSDIFVVDLASNDKTPTLITEHDGNISFSTFTFTPDSKQLIYGTDEHGEYQQAWSFDLASSEHALLQKADWDVAFLYYSRHGKYQVTGVNADAQTQLQILDTASGEAIALPALPAGDLRGVGFSSDEKNMAFYINSDTSPSNLFSYQIGDQEAKRLTNTLNPAMAEDDLVTSTVERFKSFDELEVPGLLYKPLTASADNKVPALIWIHGGPGGQSRMGYSAAKQHLINHGYALFAVNNRGSSGYGKTFYHLDDKRHGEDDLQDIVYAKKYLQQLDWVDTDNIGVIGGSYGGYLTMAAMAFTNEFKVGVNIFGVTNWVRTLESIPPWWESFRQYLYDELGDPATDKERLMRISPLFHADKIQSPVLVVQGANDPRVLQVESDEMVAEIRKNNVPVEYVLFDDEGHGFVKKQNRITASEAYLNFLNQYLITTPEKSAE